MVDPKRAIQRATDKIQLDRARSGVGWVGDRRLDELEMCDPTKAWALSFFFGGGGQLYLGDYPKGLALVTLAIASLAIVSATSFGWIPFVLTGLTGSLLAYRQARAVNRYVLARQQAQAPDAPPPAAYRLLAAKSAVDHGGAEPASAALSPVYAQLPSYADRYAPLVEQLRKVALLRAEKALNDVEHKERKQDVLEKIPIHTRDDLDDALLHLVRLRDEGVITQDDLEYLKALGPRP